MSARIISYEDYKKQNQNSDIVNTIEGKIKSNKQREEEAKKTYEETKQKQTEINKLVDTTIRDERKKLNLPQPVLKPLTTTTKVVKNDNGTTSFKSPFEQNMENSQNFRQQAGNIAKAYETIESSPKIQQLKQIATEANNARLLAKYNYDVEKENNHEITFLDRTLGVPYRAAIDFLNLDKVDGSSFETGYTTPMYVDEKGNKMFLPSANQMRQEKVRNSYDDSFLGKVAQFGTDVGYNITKIGLSTAINALTAPTGVPVGSVMYFSDMGFDNFNQAKLDGYDDASAALFSVLGVTSEMLTEKFLGGFAKKLKLGKGESSLSTFYNGLLGKLLKNDKVRSVLSNALSEGTEEFVQEFIENFNKNLVLKKENLVDATKNTFNKDVLEDAWYSALVGMGSGGLMSLGNPVINTNNTGIVPALTKEGNVNVDSYTSDLQNALAKPRYQNRADNINQTIDYLNLNKAMGNNEVAAQTMNNNIQALAPVLSQYSSVLGTSNDNVLPSKNNQVVLPKASDNINTNENINQTENITDRLQYAPTSNEKVNNLYNTASQYFNNSEQTTNLMNTLSKVIKDKGYNIVFDNTNMKGINGKIETKNGEVTITLNPDSPRAFEFVAVHEITHAIETNSLKNMIMSYAKKNGEFNAALDSLKKAYGTNDISSEVIADISGQLLGNQEFINNLSMEQPGLFKRLYNNIKAFYHKLRGWKSQDEFVQDLMNKWEYAYATQQNNLKKQSYSKQDVKTTKQNKDITVYRAGTEFGQMDTGTFFSPDEMDASNFETRWDEKTGKFKNYKTQKYTVDKSAKLYEGYSTMDYAQENNLMNIPYKKIKQRLGVDTLQEVEDIKYNWKTPSFLDENPELWTWAYQQVVQDDLKAKGYDGAHWLHEDELTPEQYQIWNNSKIKNVDNSNPTTNDDIRYSKNATEWNDYVEKNYDNKKLSKTIQKLQDKRNSGDTLNEQEFYKLYSVHKLLGKSEQDAINTIKSIQENGFKGEAGFGTNLVPSKIEYDNDGNPITWSDREYAPKKNEYVLFVPEQYVDERNGKYKIADGFKPEDYEIAKVEKDNQPYYELYKKSKAQETNNNLRDKAKSELGTTTNLNEAGYLTTDGEYLDFSGKKDGARGNQRQMDHRDIAEVYSDAEYDAAESKYSNMGSATAILQDFIDRGNIRLNNTGIEIATEPTQQQYNALYDYLEHIQKTNGEVFIDLDTETKNRTNLEYNDKTSISKMINDIKEHYQTDTTTKVTTTDNNGRTLSKAQQNYFKNSKVRDADGNLVVVYHTTPSKFTVFDKTRLGENTGYSNTAYGFFVTPSKEFSTRFGDIDNKGNKFNTMELYIDAEKLITHPYNAHYKYEGSELDNIVKNYMKAIGEKEALNELISYAKEEGMSLYDTYMNTVTTDMDDPFEYAADEKKILKKKGFDAIEFVEGNENNTINEKKGYEPVVSYAVFDSNQIKNANNINPTNDSDIRYSKNNKTWQQYLEENYISRGTKTFGKDIRKQETQNKSADHKVIQKAIEETNTLKGDNVLKAKPKETTPVEQKQDNSRLTKAEQEELNNLYIIKEFTSAEEDARMEYLENKRDGLIKYPELKQKVEFKDISKEYTKFKNDIGKFDSKLLNEAKESVKGYRNTKTKQQWLDVAENIGLHFKGNSQQLTDYAVQSWFEAQPNNKNSLNREGKGYVKFSIDEWVNAVYKGAGVGDVMPRPKAQTTTKVDTNTTYTTSDIDNMFQFDDNDNRIIALPDAVGERLATKTNMTPIEVGNLQNILYSATNTIDNGNQLEITSDYDNNIYTIKATKVGDAYVIDDVTKGTKNALGSVANIETTTNDEVESIDNKKSKIENGQTIGEVINKIKTETPKPTDQRTQYKETVEKGTDLKESSFYKNATETSQFISEDNRTKLSEVGDLKYYESVTNEESLNKASKRLKDYGTAEAYRWMQQDNKTSSATDVAEGWILLKNYQDAEDYDSMVAVAKKMREMGTVAGQTIQAYNIMARLTPEGMVKYAQSELSEALDVYSKNKSKAWLDKNASKFDLNAQEVGFIVDTMKQVESMEDGRAKNVKLAEINKMLTDKLPAERGSGIKAWMRISMLFNPKTQIRNILGNAVITPVNMVGDFFAAAADRIIAKKTNVRTTGKSDAKSYLKGFKKGLYESYDDFKRGINTRNIDANRFELGQAKSFNDNTKIGKALNRVDALNSFLLDFGDRGFYEASFTNSINNQLALNNTTKVTQDMIDIATSEALQRTWQDNNNYTKFVLTTRNMLNKVNVKGYGLGDLLIPFAKTPANLTKAIIDYSPVGMVNAILQARNLKNNISTGTNTAVQQHQFVQTLGKATAGTLLYIMAYGLAKAGIATGESDDDKDTRDFIKNTLGISSYSIRIGDKSFTYDWAQPIAAPLSIMTNIVNSKNNKGQALLESITSSFDSAGSILLEQSFLKSINDVLTDNDGIVSGLENAFLDLPARGIPTFMKQIVDMTDSTQRQTFEYNQPLKTAYNKIKAKIPGLSYTLEPSVDTLGREIQKYGGKNNIFNVFLNPANVNTSNISDAAKEIYKLYKEVGDKTIMPRVAPYYINSKGEKTILNTEQRKDFQTIAGNIIERSVNELTNNKNYKSMSDTEKSDVISKIVNYAYNKARKDVLGMDMSNEYNKINEWLDKGGTVASYYANKEEANFSLESPTKYSALQNMGINYYDYKEYQEKVNEIKKRYSGTSNASIRKQKVYEYINSLKATANQKVLLFKMLGNYSIKNFSSQAYQYINSFNISAKEKKEIWNTLF